MGFTATLVLFTISVALLISAIGSAHASVHIYDRDSFREVGDAFLLSGGSEGIVASLTAVPLTDNSIPSSIHDGRSYISGNFLCTHLENKEVYITKTGMYNLFFIFCDPNLKELTMSGKTLWKNPDGYLPGRMAPLMKFYVVMSLAYALLGIIWISQ